MLNYKGSSEIPAATAETIDQQDIDEIGTNRLAVTTNPAECGGQESLCVMDIQNMRKMPRSLAMPRMDVTMYLPINYKMQATELIGVYQEKKWCDRWEVKIQLIKSQSRSATVIAISISSREQA